MNVYANDLEVLDKIDPYSNIDYNHYVIVNEGDFGDEEYYDIRDKEKIEQIEQSLKDKTYYRYRNNRDNLIHWWSTDDIYEHYSIKQLYKLSKTN